MAPGTSTEAVRAAVGKTVFHCPSQHIVNCYAAGIEDGRAVIEMEYCGGGSLMDMLKTMTRLPAGQLLATLRQVVSGLIYLHGQQIVHRYRPLLHAIGQTCCRCV